MDRANLLNQAMRGHSLCWTFAFVLSACIYALPAHAQTTPYVPDDWRFGRKQDSSSLHFCVDERDPDFPIARKIGDALAGALLLQPKEHIIGEKLVAEDLDNLYRAFLETCDVHLGFKLIPEAYPEWVKLTRPYYRTSYVLVTTNPDWKSLADMPRSQNIGATIGTSADLRLVQHLMALPAGSRWSRFPYGSDEASLSALTKGTVGVALVWAPALWSMQKADPALAKLRSISLDPLPPSSVDVGAAVLANEAFLRSNLDQAIAALAADGTLKSILGDGGFPAAPVP